MAKERVRGRPLLTLVLITASISSFLGVKTTARADVCVEGYSSSIYCRSANKETTVAPDGSITVADTVVTGNTGMELFPRTPQQIQDEAYTPSVGEVVDKEREALDLMPKIEQAYLRETTSANTDAGSSCYVENDMPCTYWLSSQRGAAQEWQNSCGAAATRLLVWQFTSTDYGEARFRNDLKVNPPPGHSGASSGSIVQIVNRYPTPTGDKFKVSKPAGPDYYFSYVATAVWKKRHSIIQSVKTEVLPYWSGQKFWHFNLTYGYEIQGKRVVFFDEYNPAVLFGEQYTEREYPRGNPYGGHWLGINTAAAAIHANQNNVVW